MRKALSLAVVLVAAAAVAAPPLFNSPTESKWTLAKGPASLGTITLLTSANASRTELRAAKPPVSVMLGGNGKVWVRATGGDVELATLSAVTPEQAAMTALLLPFTTAAGDKVESKDGKVTSYAFRGSKATYTYDAKGPSAISLDVNGAKYTLKRTSSSASTADASNFAIRPKSGASSRLARLGGDLLGPSSSTVSATAGTRGAGTKGLKLADGGDYGAVEKLENRDANWKGKMDKALDDFQKEGKVGKAREEQQ